MTAWWVSLAFLAGMAFGLTCGIFMSWIVVNR